MLTKRLAFAVCSLICLSSIYSSKSYAEDIVTRYRADIPGEIVCKRVKVREYNQKVDVSLASSIGIMVQDLCTGLDNPSCNTTMRYRTQYTTIADIAIRFNLSHREALGTSIKVCLHGKEISISDDSSIIFYEIKKEKLAYDVKSDPGIFNTGRIALSFGLELNSETVSEKLMIPEIRNQKIDNGILTFETLANPVSFLPINAYVGLSKKWIRSYVFLADGWRTEESGDVISKFSDGIFNYYQVDLKMIDPMLRRGSYEVIFGLRADTSATSLSSDDITFRAKKLRFKIQN